MKPDPRQPHGNASPRAGRVGFDGAADVAGHGRAGTSRRSILLKTAALAASLPVLPTPAWAQRVAFNGRMGERALLVIDGEPRVLAVGASAGGVRLVSMDAARVVVDVAGERRVLSLTGGSAAGAAAPSGGREIVLAAGVGGHFFTPGLVNGRPITFLVDTGATIIALSVAMAESIGLAYRSGDPMQAHTANGTVQGHLVTLNTVRIADVQVANVRAVVIPAPMQHALLGNSFLSRFQMRRDNEILRLVLR